MTPYRRMDRRAFRFALTRTGCAAPAETDGGREGVHARFPTAVSETRATPAGAGVALRDYASTRGRD